MAARYFDVGRLAATQAEKILVGGATPGDLPVARMTDFAFVFLNHRLRREHRNTRNNRLEMLTKIKPKVGKKEHTRLLGFLFLDSSFTRQIYALFEALYHSKDYSRLQIFDLLNFFE